MELVLKHNGIFTILRVFSVLYGAKPGRPSSEFRKRERKNEICEATIPRDEERANEREGE